MIALRGLLLSDSVAGLRQFASAVAVPLGRSPGELRQLRGRAQHRPHPVDHLSRPCVQPQAAAASAAAERAGRIDTDMAELPGGTMDAGDRKSTRLNSSHVAISYAVFCL